MDPKQLMEYLKGIAKERNFDDAKTAKLLGIIEGEGDSVTLTRAEMKELLEPVVEHPFARQAAFSKAMNDGEARIKKYDEWYPQASAAANKALTEAADSKAKLEKFEKLYGKVEDIEDLGDDKGRTPSGAIVDLKKVEEVTDQKLQSWGRDTMRVVLDSNKVARDHMRRFKEIVDIDPLIERVAEKQIQRDAQGRPLYPNYGLTDAYNDEYGEQIKAMDTKAQEDRDQKLVEKGRLEERTRLGSRTGAAVRTDGDFWNKQAADEKAAGANLSTDERQAAFIGDLQTELAKNQDSA